MKLKPVNGEFESRTEAILTLEQAQRAIHNLPSGLKYNALEMLSKNSNLTEVDNWIANTMVALIAYRFDVNCVKETSFQLLGNFMRIL